MATAHLTVQYRLKSARHLAKCVAAHATKRGTTLSQELGDFQNWAKTVEYDRVGFCWLSIPAVAMQPHESAIADRVSLSCQPPSIVKSIASALEYVARPSQQ
jgi:hypothetical protein